ncbi:hypothetical protein EJB05_55371, partial [Eragrostis curvula]
MAAPALRSRASRALSGGRWQLRLLGSSSAAETGAEKEREGGERFELSAAREYYDYRKSIYATSRTTPSSSTPSAPSSSPPSPRPRYIRALVEKYGVKYSEDEILMRYRRAYEQPWGGSRL